MGFAIDAILMDPDTAIRSTWRLEGEVVKMAREKMVEMWLSSSVLCSVLNTARLGLRYRTVLLLSFLEAYVMKRLISGFSRLGLGLSLSVFGASVRSVVICQ